jgi:8-oxo-dGTP pyrophosphatase MutT (NUDIX family)
VIPSLDTDPHLLVLSRSLAGRATPGDEPAPGAGVAAVALVVRPALGDLELLLIRRAERERDPWSGHMAFPGGRADVTDATLQATAMRETLEEVGIDLGRAGRYLGALDTLHPRAGAPRIVVSPFAFAVEHRTIAIPNAEVDSAFWIPLAELATMTARTEYQHHLANGAALRVPALRYRDHVIWGLTYRILTQFVALAGRPALPESSAWATQGCWSSAAATWDCASRAG